MMHLVVKFIKYNQIWTSKTIHISNGTQALPTFLQKCTYTSNSLQIPDEMNSRDSKRPITFVPYHTKYDYRADYWLLKTYFAWFLSQCCAMISKYFYSSPWCVNLYILLFASHNLLHRNGCSEVVNLLSSAPGTALHLHESQQKILNTCRSKLKACSHFFSSHLL